MSDGERVTLTGGQAKRLLLGLAVIVLVVIVMASVLRRVEKPAPPFAVSESAAAVTLGRTGVTKPEQNAERERGIKILLGGGGVYTDDPSALNKSVGEPVVLQTGEKTPRVTLVRVAAGTAACAAGPLVTADLLVEPPSGLNDLPPGDFHLMTSDGSAATPIEECSKGFAEVAAQRTLVFAATDPDRLVIGTDPIDPVVVWHLS